MLLYNSHLDSTLGKSTIPAMAQQDIYVDYKGTSIAISVTTKMLYIDSTKLHQKAFEGKPWKATITLETLTEACETGQQPKMATLPCSPRQRPIVASPRFSQLMPPQKSYTPPHKNLIFLISFPCWATVCNISTKAVVSFLGLNTGQKKTDSPESKKLWIMGLKILKNRIWKRDAVLCYKLLCSHWEGDGCRSETSQSCFQGQWSYCCLVFFFLPPRLVISCVFFISNEHIKYNNNNILSKWVKAKHRVQKTVTWIDEKKDFLSINYIVTLLYIVQCKHQKRQRKRYATLSVFSIKQ